ncbi:MAG: YceI family protein [Desulfohalobiaceae bacterium]
MPKVFRSLILAAFLLAVPGMLTQAFAAGQWEIDKQHSSFYFDIRHTFATVRGQFEDFSGSVAFDAEAERVESVEFSVRVASVNTQITKRDNHLRSEDFFHAKRHPRMTFKSSNVEHREGDRFVAEGELTIKSVSKEVAIPFTYLGMRDNPLQKGQKVAGFEAEFSLDRLEYDVGTGKFVEMGVVEREVNVLVTLELLKDQ